MMSFKRLIHNIGVFFIAVTDDEDKRLDADKNARMHSHVFIYDLFEKMYYEEQARKDRLERQLSFPFGVMMITASAMLYCAKIAIRSENTYYSHMLILICVITLISLIVAAVFLAFSFVIRTKYNSISYTNALRDHVGDLKKWAKNIEGECEEENVEKEMRHLMVGQFSECTDTNMRINDDKARYLFYGKSIIFVVAVLFVGFACYPTYKIELYTSKANKALTSSIQSKGDLIDNGKRQSIQQSTATTTTANQANPRRGEKLKQNSKNR